MIWPITIKSNKCRKAARRSFAVGADCLLKLLDIDGDVDALDGRDLRHAARQASQEFQEARSPTAACRVRFIVEGLTSGTSAPRSAISAARFFSAYPF